MYKFFKKICNTDHIAAWKSKGLSDENIKPPSSHDNSLACDNSPILVLKQD